MPLSTDVNLPRSHRARFPSRCVRCGEDPSGKTIRLWTHTLGWWTWILWMFGRGFTVHVPACSRCGWCIRCQRFGGLLLTIAVAAAFMFFIWPHLDDLVARAIRKWVAMALILVCLAPYFLWQGFFPPSFDITAYPDKVDYEFRDPEYAYEFAALNEDADWVKVD